MIDNLMNIVSMFIVTFADTYDFCYWFCFIIMDRSQTSERNLSKSKEGEINPILENPGSPPGPCTSVAWNGLGTEHGIGNKNIKWTQLLSENSLTIKCYCQRIL